MKLGFPLVTDFVVQGRRAWNLLRPERSQRHVSVCAMLNFRNQMSPVTIQ